MLKKLCYLTAVLCTLLLLGALSVSAAPTEMNKIPESKGLICIDIYNPETVVSTTTQSDYVLSGIANPGVVVSVYYQEKSTGKYKGSSDYRFKRIFRTACSPERGQKQSAYKSGFLVFVSDSAADNVARNQPFGRQFLGPFQKHVEQP